MKHAAFLLQNLRPAIPIRAVQRMQHRHLRFGLPGCAREREGMVIPTNGQASLGGICFGGETFAVLWPRLIGS
jgi:hypothetical protein